VSTISPIDVIVHAAYRGALAAATWLITQIAKEVGKEKAKDLGDELEDLLKNYEGSLRKNMDRAWGGHDKPPWWP
jgi:hypothetical protein